ncbi:MAG: hypothetical protein JO182_05445 [Acidobacteriaceae bacterium]|nr:hypothetical protein [Acidobacteriaceae bacterium]
MLLHWPGRGLACGEEITGYVSEAHCGAKHSSVSEANSKCIAGCLKGGADPVLVRYGKILTFDTDSKEKAKAFAGQNVKVNGTVEGSMIKVESISKAE